MKKLNKVLWGLVLVCIIAIVVLIRQIYLTHPIVLKWLTGTARIIGKPINAIVYTDGQPNNDIKIYKCEYKWDNKKTRDSNYFLLSLKEFDKDGMLSFIHVDTNEKWVGRPVGTAIDCYDFVGGNLFQDETGSNFVDFKDDMKGERRKAKQPIIIVMIIGCLCEKILLISLTGINSMPAYLMIYSLLSYSNRPK